MVDPLNEEKLDFHELCIEALMAATKYGNSFDKPSQEEANSLLYASVYSNLAIYDMLHHIYHEILK